MKQLGTFLKTTTLGGLFVLLPVVVVLYLLRQVFQIAVGVATPVASALSKTGIHERKLTSERPEKLGLTRLSLRSASASSVSRVEKSIP